MIAIPNMDKPQNITRCSYKINPEECKCIYTDKVFEETLALILDHPCPDCPLIEIVTCKECKYSKIYALQSDAPMKRWCHKGHFPKEVTDGYYCGDGKTNADQHIQCVESVGK